MKAKIYFGLLALLFALGCSNEELINNPTENSLLSKGIGVNYITFYGNSIDENSIDENSFFKLAELNDESKILKNGKCSGKITGYGSINSNLSKYNFISCDREKNPAYPESYREFEYNYKLVGGGKVCLNTVDYFEFSFIKGLYIPGNYEPGYAGLTDWYKGGMFICNNSGQGEAKITAGSGKFKAFAGRPLEVYRAGGVTGIDRLSGKMYLQFNIRN